MKSILGIDCGDVIFREITGRRIPGAIPAIKKLVDSKKFSEIYIISKAGIIPRLIFRFRLWRHRFWKRTGIPKTHLRFCYHYEDKAAICEELGVSHFIDDRLRVLHFLKKVRHRYAFKPRRIIERLEYPEVYGEVTVVKNWEELLTQIL